MGSELGKRVAVAAVGVPFAALLLYIGGWPLTLLLAAIAAGGALELYRMAGVLGARPFAPFGAALAAVLVLFAQLFSALERAAWSWTALMAGALALGAAAIWRRGPEGKPLSSIAITLFGAVLVGGGLSYAVLLRGIGTNGALAAAPAVAITLANAHAAAVLLAFPIALTWLGDSFAYFGGRKWGRRKLIPSVSPGKTIAGALSSVIGSILVGAAYAVFLLDGWVGVPISPMHGALLGLLVSVAAQVGDLTESLLKREAGVKDSGTLLPGHGGILDRFDALFFTLPVAYWYLLLILPYTVR